MKIRNGFVSNSSSSSFVVVCSEDAYKKALNEAHPYVKAAVEYATSYNKTIGTLHGQKVVIFGHFSDAGGDYTWQDFSYSGPEWKYDGEHDDYRAYLAFEEFVKSIPKEEKIEGSIGDGG